MKRGALYWGIGITVALILVLMISFSGDDFASVDNNTDAASGVIVDTSAPAPAPSAPTSVNYQTYNIDYMNDAVKARLVNQAGATGKTAFYLPPTGYVNVSRGTKYGIAWIIQNVNPKIPEGNEFSFNFNVDANSVGDCGVSESVAQGWIERGMASTGMISGQWREDWNEWYDAMTIYFAFPSNVEPCNVKYNFVITKDGTAYDSRVLEFNLI